MLQGSLDNFTLDEVLNLLSGTAKTGHLRVSGDRGTGSLWVEEGFLVQAEASNVVRGGDFEDVMFELLRFESGNFSFVADDIAPHPTDAQEIEPLVERGRDLLVEWQSIEAVIPSPDHLLHTVRSLPSEQVMLTNAEWETVIAIGEGRSVAQTCTLLEVGELKGCRRIKSVVERGLVSIGEPTLHTSIESDSPALAEASVDSMPSLEAPAPFESEEATDESNVVPLPISEDMFIPDFVEEDPAAAVVAAVPPTPPPAPPSPEEIRQFSESVEDVGELGAAAPPPPPPPPALGGETNADGSAAADDEASLLMKYLQSDT